jgi:alpha-L-rhamnosidase
MENNWQSDELVRHILSPQRIVWHNRGKGNLENIDTLLDKSNCVISCSQDESPAIVFDFGQELNGGIRLEFANTTPSIMVKVRIRFGESVSEVMHNPNNDHCIHDVTLDMSVMGRHEFGNTGFRFVRLDFIGCDVKVNFAGIKAIALERDIEYKGRFESSDELLNRIWKTGARTVHLCCQDYIYDGIKRDRIVWVGDIHPQMKVIASVFGQMDIVPRSLDFVFNNTPKNEWMNGVSAYSIWWLITVWDWYFITGNKDWLKSKQKDVETITNQLISHIDENGKEMLGGMRFIDWSIGFDEILTQYGLQALMVLGFRKTKQIFDELGILENSNKCQSAINLLATQQTPKNTTKQINALRVLAGMTDAAEANENSFNFEPYKEISLWYGYYVLQSRAMAGDISGCLEFIRKLWGGMLELGATTFWEHFDIAWLENSSRIDELVLPNKIDVHGQRGEHCYKGYRHSLCHGWSAGPTAWLSEYVLGVKILSPGLKKIKVTPNLDNLEYVSGAFPTQYGLLEIEHKKCKNGKVETKTKKPDEIEIQK